MTEKILAISKVIEIVGFSARTLYKEVAAGRFPRRIQITPGRVGWLESDVKAWLDKRVAA
jgi:prophage regulatory protein